MPHVTIGATSRQAERFWGVGNERTVVNFPDWGIKDAGIKIKSTDRFSSLLELMNDTDEDRTVWLTVTYDILDQHPFKDNIRNIWMDIRQCGTSQINPPNGKLISV